MLRHELLLSEAELTQVIRALRLQPFRPRVGKGREKQEGQDTDDSNNDHQFN
jgi:hypothetical protein